MKGTNWNRIVLAVAITAASAVAMAQTTYAEQRRSEEDPPGKNHKQHEGKKHRQHEQKKVQEAADAQHERQKVQQHQQHKRRDHREQVQQHREDRRDEHQKQVQQKQERKQEHQAEVREHQQHKRREHREQVQQQQERKQEHRHQVRQHQEHQRQKHEHKAQQQLERREERRLSQQQQQQRIEHQRRRLVQYRQHLEQQQRRVRQQSIQLQQAKRMAQYHFQQQYLERLHQQQLRIDAQRDYDYANDPYYYTPPSHRYYRGGSYHETNRYGVELLQRAVNLGYGEGLRAGQADQQDRWGSSYRDSYAYQDANYGYDGRYVERDDYNHYFREGFRRGYEDGYGSRSEYGSFTDGKQSMLSSVLSAILNMQSLQ